MAPIGQIFTHVLQSLQELFISIHVSTSSSAAIGHTLTQAPQYPHLYRFTVTVIVKLQHQQSDNKLIRMETYKTYRVQFYTILRFCNILLSFCTASINSAELHASGITHAGLPVCLLICSGKSFVLVVLFITISK